MTDGRTALYRIWGDADLLYIGITNNFGRRWNQHAKRQPWWDEMRRLTVDEWFGSREDAEAAEVAAIRAENPKYNQVHADPSQRHRGRGVRKAAPLERTLTTVANEPFAPIPEMCSGTTLTRITDLRVQYPAYARDAEKRRCILCGAGPGGVCRTKDGRVAYYHRARFDRIVSPADTAAPGQVAFPAPD